MLFIRQGTKHQGPVVGQVAPGSRLLVPVANQVKKAYLLSQPMIALKSEKSDAGQTLAILAAAPDANSSVVVVEIEGAPDVLASSPALHQAAGGSMISPTFSSRQVARPTSIRTRLFPKRAITANRQDEGNATAGTVA